MQLKVICFWLDFPGSLAMARFGSAPARLDFLLGFWISFQNRADLIPLHDDVMGWGKTTNVQNKHEGVIKIHFLQNLDQKYFYLWKEKKIDCDIFWDFDIFLQNFLYFQIFSKKKEIFSFRFLGNLQNIFQIFNNFRFFNI